MTVDGQEETEPAAPEAAGQAHLHPTGKNITTMTTNTSMTMGMSTAMSHDHDHDHGEDTTITTTPPRATSGRSSTASPCPRR